FDATADGASIVALELLFQAVDRLANGGPVILRELALVLLQQLFHLVDALIRFIAGIDQLALLFVVRGMRFRFSPPAVHLALFESAGAFDANLLLLAGALVLRGDIQDAVGIDVKGDFDLRHAAWSRRNVLEIETAQQTIILGELALALEDADRHGGLVVLGG